MNEARGRWLSEVEDAALHDNSRACVVIEGPNCSLCIFIDGAFDREARPRPLIEDRASFDAILRHCQLELDIVILQPIASHLKYPQCQQSALSRLLHRPLRRA